MVSIRLSRSGAKKRPFYHIVVADSRERRDGRYIERLGFFYPIATGKEESLRLDLTRTNYWLKVGAKPTERVTQLIKQHSKTPPVETATAAPTDNLSAKPVEKPSAEATSTSPEATSTSPEATSTSPEATSTSPEATSTSPEATSTSPEATSTSTDTAPSTPTAETTSAESTSTKPTAS
ncbi:MAG: 30S ribosomal protein S16 [Thiomargarita sp.]|nr:30S ribosomal protein S16 [Thiomargarita sp.]